MSVNTAHANNGVLIYAGESIILYCNAVTMGISKELDPALSGDKKGRIYLTTHRIIFVNDDKKNKLMSVSVPFFALSKVELEQPIFGANYIKGKMAGQADGGFGGRVVDFKLVFKKGGAIEFGQAMLKVASMAGRISTTAPPPYMAPPMGQYGPAPPPAYSPPTQGYGGWVPPTSAFPDRPQAGEVYQYDAPPPYPGMGADVGFVLPTNGATNGTGPDAKAAEASAAYYAPNAPHYAYAPPPPYSEQNPTYGASKKQD